MAVPEDDSPTVAPTREESYMERVGDIERIDGGLAVATEAPPAYADVAVVGAELDYGESPPLGHPDGSGDQTGAEARRWNYSHTVSKPVRAVGGFVAMSLDTLVLIFKPPFAWREFLLQSWFVARVSILPTIMLAIPFTVLLIFTFNILLVEFGAADFSGTGAAYGAVTQIGPIVTVLVVAGAGATAMCADLGARTIREELDALRVMGVNPIQSLVVPRVLAATVVATLLSSVVILVGLVGSFMFSVFIQHVTPGSFVGGLTIITGVADVLISIVKAALFGLSAGLIACYKGISVGGGPAGVGNAVNETVVFTFMALFAINIIATAVGVQATL